MQEQEPVKKSVENSESDVVKENLITELRRVRELYENAADPAEKGEINLKEFPKMIAAIREAELENIRRREQGGEELDVALLAEVKNLAKYGLDKENLEGQKKFAQEDWEKMKAKG